MDKIVQLLLKVRLQDAHEVAIQEYPFEVVEKPKHNYSKATMMKIIGSVTDVMLAPG